ncbi:hypothetical protein C1645_832389 [Glomus cerebriforme]|uniref:Uncharacterized protein n=1 Tax=Glomus cerebriforme TaxID=658196 RepID=A0A397SNE2_9GLOM|nr:hypothetical protein C1645_832389 [Glomus cerebriforme]
MCLFVFLLLWQDGQWIGWDDIKVDISIVKCFLLTIRLFDHFLSDLSSGEIGPELSGDIVKIAVRISKASLLEDLVRFWTELSEFIQAHGGCEKDKLLSEIGATGSGEEVTNCL